MSSDSEDVAQGSTPTKAFTSEYIRLTLKKIMQFTQKFKKPHRVLLENDNKHDKNTILNRKIK